MVQHKPWQFFIFLFDADDGKHTVSVGAESRVDAVDLIMDMYSSVSNLRVFKREDIL